MCRAGDRADFLCLNFLFRHFFVAFYIDIDFDLGGNRDVQKLWI